MGAAITALASFVFCRDAPPTSQLSRDVIASKRPSMPQTVLCVGVILVSAYSMLPIIDDSPYTPGESLARLSTSIFDTVEHNTQSAHGQAVAAWYECLQDTSSRFVDQLRADLDDPGRNRTIAIVDVPLHANLGDSFIVLGQIRAVLRLGMCVGTAYSNIASLRTCISDP
jgi:hypothetical protein